MHVFWDRITASLGGYPGFKGAQSERTAVIPLDGEGWRGVSMEGFRDGSHYLFTGIANLTFRDYDPPPDHRRASSIQQWDEAGEEFDCPMR